MQPGSVDTLQVLHRADLRIGTMDLPGRYIHPVKRLLIRVPERQLAQFAGRCNQDLPGHEVPYPFLFQFINNPAQALGETIRKPVAVVGNQFTQAPGGAASPGPVRVAELISGISWGASTFSNCTGRALVKS